MHTSMIGRWSGQWGQGATFSVAGVGRAKTEDKVRPVLSKVAEKSQKSWVPLCDISKMTKEGRGPVPPLLFNSQDSGGDGACSMEKTLPNTPEK